MEGSSKVVNPFAVIDQWNVKNQFDRFNGHEDEVEESVDV